MKTIYKILIYIGITLLLCIFSFIIGRATFHKDFDINELNTIKIKLENQQKKNEELIQYISNCESIINKLNSENDDLNSKIQTIISCTNEMQNKLNQTDYSISSSLDYIKILERNNKILQEYVTNMEVLTNE